MEQRHKSTQHIVGKIHAGFMFLVSFPLFVTQVSQIQPNLLEYMKQFKSAQKASLCALIQVNSRIDVEQSIKIKTYLEKNPTKVLLTFWKNIL